MNIQRLADQLRVMRYRSGLDQSQLAERSGVHVKTISSYETGQRTNTMKVQQLDQLAAAVGLTITEALAIEPTDEERIVLRLDARSVALRRKPPAPPVAFVRHREPSDPFRNFLSRNS